MGTWYEMRCRRCHGATNIYFGHNRGSGHYNSCHELVALSQSKSLKDAIEVAKRFNAEGHEFRLYVSTGYLDIDLQECGFVPACQHYFAVLDGYNDDIPASEYPSGSMQSAAFWCSDVGPQQCGGNCKGSCNT